MSNIEPSNIDVNYPIPGQDNDSQGFRDNFFNIRHGLQVAKTELADLQSKAVLKSQLAIGSPLNNDMAYTPLIRPLVTRAAESSAATTSTINYTNGHYQVFELTVDTTLGFSNFPATGQSGWVKLEIRTGATGYDITLPAEVTYSVTGTSRDISMSPNTRTIVEFRGSSAELYLTSLISLQELV